VEVRYREAFLSGTPLEGLLQRHIRGKGGKEEGERKKKKGGGRNNKKTVPSEELLNGSFPIPLFLRV
jgi:hypothetical protein